MKYNDISYYEPEEYNEPKELSAKEMIQFTLASILGTMIFIWLVMKLGPLMISFVKWIFELVSLTF